ncbi:MAG: 50S ribosomal protein L21 [Elusimicrobia bacterium]|nr:50S ribosomal protein L21 [Elusimicrobiota bacterium]
MYAVIEESGFQYRVNVGDIIDVARLEKKPGEKVKLAKVLLVGDGDKISVGQPILDNAAVNAEVILDDRKRKVVVYKYKPKKSYALMKGHRQDFTRIKITDISR